ncbi:MAG: hypothetical protein LIR46_04750 [Bacteroidota bacterium]|nr:hypothetical protein [Bacteroidota bacterium]
MKVQQIKQPNFRSSRFYAPAIINPVMISPRMAVDKNDWSHVEIPEEGEDDPTFAYFEVSESSYVIGHEAYKAFQHEPNEDGWLCEVNQEGEKWIALDTVYNFKNSYTPEKRFNEPFTVSKLEVYNHCNKNFVCKQFEFQGWMDGDWQPIRVCKAVKTDPTPIVVSALPTAAEQCMDYIYQVGSYYYDCVFQNGSYQWVRRTGKNATIRNKSVFQTELKECKKYRLIVQVPVGIERVGFACVNMYTILDHDEIAYGTISYKGRTFPRLWEKIYSSNDECENLVWEKIHDKHLLVCATSWYPGDYASTNYTIGITHPDDTIEIETVNQQGQKVRKVYSNGPFTVAHPIGGEVVCPTKNYLVVRTGSYYYSYKNAIRYTHDGKDWTRTQDGLPGAFWLGGGGGWAETDDLGICAAQMPYASSGPSYIWRLSLDGTKVNVEKLYEIGKDGIVSGSIIGNLYTQGTYRGPNGLECYKFMNADGEIYNSPLQAQYQWTDMQQSDPAKRVITQGCSWTFAQIGKYYYAAAKHYTIRYYNEVLKQWQFSYRFVVLRSSDAFKSYTVIEEIDPCPEYRYREWGFGRIGTGAVIIERWAEVEGGQITNRWHTNIDGITCPDYVDIPLIGVNSDPLYRAVRIAFSSNVTNGGDESIRVDNFGVHRNFNVGCIIDGKPAIPDYWMLPTAFKQNNWLSPAYNTGGFIVINKNLTGGYAYTTDNYMIDRHNYTYQNIRS